VVDVDRHEERDLRDGGWCQVGMHARVEELDLKQGRPNTGKCDLKYLLSLVRLAYTGTRRN